MNTINRKISFLIIVGLLAVLSLGQLVYAQEPEESAPAVPQWVKDRQQYETNYIYVPCTSDVEVVFPVPQWVKDRQQYETSYVYVPPAAEFSAIYNRCGQIRNPDW